MSSLMRAVALPLLLLVGFLVPSPPSARATSGARDPVVSVIVRLAGQPLAADMNLKARTRFTKWRLRLDPTLRPAVQYRSRLTAYQRREIAYLRSRGLQFRVNRQFNVLLNGFSAYMRRSQLSRLQGMPNVELATIEPRYYLQLDRSTTLVHAQEAWTQLGGAANAGKGMMIANLDTGIDISHPCFSDKGFAPPPLGRHSDTAANLKLTNNKVIVARAFGGDASKSFSAADSVGHGTFGAAIEACDYNTPTPIGTSISGVAPAAYLMSYNVFPGDACGNSGSSCDSIVEDPILAGLQAALLDGADVINMSLGGSLASGDLSLDPFAQAVDLASAAGVPIVVSAGNAGPTLVSVSSPAVAPSAIAVGATTNSRVVVTSSVTVNGPAPVPAQLVKIRSSQGTRTWKGPLGPYGMVYVGLGRMPNDDTANPQANDFAGKDLKGKVALIQRGTLFFETKLNNAMKAGAVAAIIFDNIDQLSFSGDSRSATLPTAYVSKSDGQALLTFLQAHPDATVTLNSDISTYDVTPNALADFSSRGIGPDYSIKPDLVAPGQDIYSATESSIPNSQMYNPTGFTSADGTSFSAPHVTGAVALVLQKHPKWTPAMVKSVLVQSTDRVVTESATNPAEPPVTEQGSGLLDVNRALQATAYVSPASLTFGQVNMAERTSPLSSTLTFNDVGGGAGTWNITVQPLEGATNAKITVPASVQLPANGKVSIPVRLTPSVSGSANTADGFVTLTKGTQTVRLSYFVHIVNQPIKPGSVLLVDATTSRFAAPAGQPPIQRTAVDQYYKDALTRIGKTYTYWDEFTLGSPSVADMQRASAVIVFTGANLNGFAAQNDNYEALLGPLDALDVTAIRQYLNGGGRVFLSGLSIDLSDPYWAVYVLGSDFRQLSAYDNTTNDKKQTGGISPPQPSTAVPTLNEGLRNPYIFGNMKAIDFSTKGDGAKDNVAVYSRGVDQSGNFADGLVGVTGIKAINGCDQLGCAYGQAALQVPDLSLGGPDIGVVASDEPTLKHQPKYKGRSVYFSFDFAGINNNTGYATREQVLQRVFAWLEDTPSVTIGTRVARARKAVRLQATLKTVSGFKAARFVWQVNGKTLKATSRPVSYAFPRAGVYRLRVQVTDTLGHNVVSSVRNVRVR